jgi:peptide/nickel transport system permease protein
MRTTGPAGFILRRILWALVLTWVVGSGTFLLGYAAGSDFVRGMLDMTASARIIDAARAQRGLDQPILTRYQRWFVGTLRLDLGHSLLYDRPVGPLVLQRAGNTALLGTVAFLIAIGLGVPAGLLTGSQGSRAPARLVKLCSLLLLSCPPLVASLVLVWAAAVTGFAPVGGMSSAGAYATSRLDALLDVLAHIPVPALALGLPLAAIVERVQCDALSRALSEPCITAARARGIGPSRLIWYHGLRLAAGPVLSVLGLLAGVVLSGSVAVELVTSWPGLGRLTYDAMYSRDLALAAGCTTVAAILLSAAVLAADVALRFADPRVEHLEMAEALS